MLPTICGFISRAIYDGRLKAENDNGRQVLVLSAAHEALQPSGIRLIEMEHSGCGQRRHEEVGFTAELIDSLLRQRYVDRAGNEKSLGLENSWRARRPGFAALSDIRTLPEPCRV